MDGQLGTLDDLQYIYLEGFPDRIKNWRGEILTEEKLMKILIPLRACDSRQIEAVKELQFLYDCREYGEPEYELGIVNL
jgi:hypothetical protein